MKLYSMPGACSTAVHIVLEWSGRPYKVETVIPQSLKAPDFLAINPAGAVPALIDGDLVLTQNAAIMGYIADGCPEAGLCGDGSPRQRAEATRWLAFVNSDLHPAFRPIFATARYIGDDAQHDAVRAAARTQVRGLMADADRRLADTEWLAGFRSFADPYFYMTLRWAHGTGVDMTGFDNLTAFQARMEADPGVQTALKAEGLA